MKRSFLPASILTFFLMFPSCIPIMKKINGVTRPEFVTEQQTRDFLRRKGVREDRNFYVCKDSASILKIIVLLRSIPEANFFNRKGELLVYADSSCPGKACLFAKSLKKDSVYRVNSSYHLPDVMKLIKPVSDNAPLQDDETEYTVLLYWAIFAGKINKSVFDIGNELEKKDSPKIRVAYVNVDFLRSWGMKKIPGN
jgi:hypothetical protein